MMPVSPACAGGDKEDAIAIQFFKGRCIHVNVTWILTVYVDFLQGGAPLECVPADFGHAVRDVDAPQGAAPFKRV